MAAAVFRGPFRALASPRFTVPWVAVAVQLGMIAVTVLFVHVLLRAPSRFLFLPQHAASTGGLDRA